MLQGFLNESYGQILALTALYVPCPPKAFEKRGGVLHLLEMAFFSAPSPLKRMCHIQDRHGQILALARRHRSSKCFNFPSFARQQRSSKLCNRAHHLERPSPHTVDYDPVFKSQLAFM